MKRLRVMLEHATPGRRPDRIRALIVDEHELVRRGLSVLIGAEADLEVCGALAVSTFDSHLLATLRPDVVLLDVSTAPRTGINLVKVMRATAPAVRIVALSVYRRPETVGSLLSAGASEFVLKTDVAERLLAAVRRGRIAAAAPKARALRGSRPLAIPPLRGNKETFSAFERQIMELIGAGVPMPTIAARLQVSRTTVESRVRSIKIRLHVASAVALVRRCVALQRQRRRRNR